MALGTGPSPDVKKSWLPAGLHYAWVIVAILAAVHVIGESIGMSAGVMVVPLNDPDGDFGWGMATIGLALMTFFLTGAVVAPITGWLGVRFGPRTLMLGNTVLLGGSLILIGNLTEPWQYFVLFGVLLAISNSICMVPLVATVSDWFRRRLGLAVGITLSAGAIGSALMAVLLGYLIDSIGWRNSFWLVGAVGGGGLLVLTLLFRNYPSDIGVTPYGTTERDADRPPMSKEMEMVRSSTFNQAIRRTRAFWNLPLIHGLGCAGHGIILIFAIPLAYERGAFTSLGSAALILAIINIFSVVSRFVSPMLAERFGGRPIMAVSLFVQGITVVVLFWASDAWAFYLFAAIFGVGFGAEMSAYLVVNRQYFGEGPIATCYGFQQSGALIGHAVATGLAGAILYVTGSYGTVLVLSIIFSLVGVGVIMTMESGSKVLIPDWDKSLPPEAQTSPFGPTGPIPHWDP